VAVGDETDEERRLATRIESLEARLAERDAKLAERDAKLAELVELVAKLTGQIEKLTEQLGQNSKNSHRPPSSDGPGSAPSARSRV
jgi:transposase